MNERVRPTEVDVGQVLSGAGQRVLDALSKEDILEVDALIRSSEEDVTISICEFESGDYESAAKCLVDGAVNLLLSAICFQRMANSIPVKADMH
ncbi:hypothetical protein [Acetobacter cibinongensis]|uniref:Uncharacterized protein n=1 Tax=Acetobacter cibinongensis TaxID=146475 RepID=A0A1Z5YTD0_9PROT|nr:hypothetical protein [Acetobacter cibinongensis]OUJ01542.1 hypothetical protein HK14_08890 [Acetobacter cibinongensis]